jgi:hypothetical protein
MRITTRAPGLTPERFGKDTVQVQGITEGLVEGFDRVKPQTYTNIFNPRTERTQRNETTAHAFFEGSTKCLLGGGIIVFHTVITLFELVRRPV